ncbi:hypothetical protein D9M68_743700 [compost metagenome]
MAYITGKVAESKAVAITMQVQLVPRSDLNQAICSKIFFQVHPALQTYMLIGLIGEGKSILGTE